MASSSKYSTMADIEPKPGEENHDHIFLKQTMATDSPPSLPDIATLCTAPGAWPLRPDPEFVAMLSDARGLTEDLGRFVRFSELARSYDLSDTPTWSKLLRHSGTDSSRCYRRYAGMAIFLTQSSHGLVLSLSFFGFGTPLSVALIMCFPYLCFIYSNVFHFHAQVNNAGFAKIFKVVRKTLKMQQEGTPVAQCKICSFMASTALRLVWHGAAYHRAEPVKRDLVHGQHRRHYLYVLCYLQPPVFLLEPRQHSSIPWQVRK